MARAEIEITSYGVLHHDPPAGDALTVDLTSALRNPHHDPALRYLTGLDAPVREHVLTTPGARALIERTVRRTRALAADAERHGEPLLLLHIYCQGGRHRSVAVAEAVAQRLLDTGYCATVTHRHIARPVLQR